MGRKHTHTANRLYESAGRNFRGYDWYRTMLRRSRCAHVRSSKYYQIFGSFDEWEERGGHVANLSVLGGDGTKKAPPGNIFYQTLDNELNSG